MEGRVQSIAKQSTFMAGSLPRAPFPALVRAAASQGYDSITLWPNIWRHAQRRGGLTLAAMRRILEDHQVSLADAEGCNDWYTAGEGNAARFAVSRNEILDVCAA